MSKKVIIVSAYRPESLRCITRVVVNEPKKTRGWNVRVFRRGTKISKFFSDAKFGGRAGAFRACGAESDVADFRQVAARSRRARSALSPAG